MIKLFLDHLPIAKKRHRHGYLHGRSITWDPQNADKMKTKWLLAKLYRSKGHLKPLQGPIEVWVQSSYPFPKSWSKKRVKMEKEKGSWKISKPDSDNNFKFYSDVLNGIAYQDDAQAVDIWSTKKYSDMPGVEITIIPKGCHMIHEHALNIKKSFSIQEISYLVKKANKLGKSGRSIESVIEYLDDDGKHILFEVEELKQKRESSDFLG